MTAVDHRASPQDSARSAWHAYRVTQGEALENVTQEQLFYEAFARGVAWHFRVSGMLSPYLDCFVRVVDYLSHRADVIAAENDSGDAA